MKKVLTALQMTNDAIINFLKKYWLWLSLVIVFAFTNSNYANKYFNCKKNLFSPENTIVSSYFDSCQGNFLDNMLFYYCIV